MSDVAILGYGREGRAAHNYWQARGAQITVCDGRTDLDLPDGTARRTGPGHLGDLEDFDVIVRSPVVRPRDIAAANTPAILRKVTSGTNEFLRVCPTRNVIGVTGTKGKGTTSTLIARMLEATGQRVHLGGNIGIPALSLLPDIRPDDWVVLELSSYQLIDLQYAPRLAVCLMITPEHLDWHTDMAEYVGAKARLFAAQKPDDTAIYYGPDDLSRQIASAGPAHLLAYGGNPPGGRIEQDAVMIGDQAICRTDEIRLLGGHNWQNVCAAVTAAWQVAPEPAGLRQAVTTFTGLPFRLEFRREVDGVRYYDDSFASAPGAAIAALRALQPPKVMILGGHDRGLDLTALADTMAQAGAGLRHALLVGEAAGRLQSELQEHGCHAVTVSQARTMPEIVAQAAALARPGDCVVLSPGFPSFDMFRDFEDRGNQFNAAVAAL